MQNRNNDMDNKLRQLENQSLPDLSSMDKHWQEMKTMLAPATAPESSGGKTGIWKWFVAAVVIGGLVWLAGEISTPKTSSNTSVTNTESREITQPPKNIAIADTEKVFINQDTTSRPGTTEKITAVLKPQPAIPYKQVYASIVKEPCDKCGTDWLNEPLPDTTNRQPEVKTDPKTTLAAFFAQLEKPAQEFLIDNMRDTVIAGKDGTALLIPANTFNTNGKVTLVLKEYYSYEDIITNKLSTTSNGQQLVTGGMIHLAAMVDGKMTDIQPNKSIRWFIPDTSANMQGMQLFTGQQSRQPLLQYRYLVTRGDDTLDFDERYNDLNWTPQNTFFQTTGNNQAAQNPQVRVIDLRDYPFKITTGKKTKAYYYLYQDSHISKEELTAYLKARNKWYDKIIIRKTKHEDDWCTYKGFYSKEIDDCYTSLGDTMTIAARLANIYKLKIIDTVPVKTNLLQYGLANNTQRLLFELNERYGVDITTLGWINCDRFYYNNNERVPYIVDINDTASNYYTILVFDKIKSMMTGSVSGNKVMFANLPVGETAKVISVGIKDGKPVAAMETVQISKNGITDLKFEETTPSEFRQQAASMDK